MANTAIFTESGIVLNSEKCQNYGLLIIDIGENFDQEDYIRLPFNYLHKQEKRRLYQPSMK